MYDDFEVGDRVRCIKVPEDGEIEVGELGTVVRIGSWIGVCWDEYGEDRHSEDGHCDNRHGWSVHRTCIEPFHPVELEEFDPLPDEVLMGFLV